MKELQDFLRQNNVEFDVEPPIEQVEAGRAKKEEGKANGKGGYLVAMLFEIFLSA